MELWIGCVAGALRDDEYTDKLTAAGFENVDIEATRIYTADEAREFLSGHGLNVDTVAHDIDEKFISAFVRAAKPAAGCCSPGCCT
jgi:hypothetical protein